VLCLAEYAGVVDALGSVGQIDALRVHVQPRCSMRHMALSPLRHLIHGILLCLGVIRDDIVAMKHWDSIY
jgi:multisubunit Na+/H+ antiporter MnhF subunit